MAGGFFAWRAYQFTFQSNVVESEEPYVIIVNQGETFDELLQDLDSILVNKSSFVFLAEYKELPLKLKPGRYSISPGMNNNSLVNMFRAGLQSPVRLTINLAYDLPKVAGQAAKALEADSLSILQYLESEEVLADFNISRQELEAYFLANTYEFYWNTSPKGFVERMQRESERFWAKRAALLEASPLAKEEIITLASIVESETAKPSEMPIVAGVYLNRLRQGVRLQSDPTVIYAWKQIYGDTTFYRVLNRHKKVDSPYNTYIYDGLPPGPLRIPDPRTIDAVLEAEKHNYLFMCADPDRLGYHVFAQTNRQHEINSARYRAWLDKMGY